MKKIFFLLILPGVAACIIGYHHRINTLWDVVDFAWLSFSDADPMEERAAAAGRAKGDVVIGIAGPLKTHRFKSFLEGARLAANEINASGGVLGRKIRLMKGDDRGREDVGEGVAQRFCGNKDMIAVLGHMDSGVSKSTAVLYDYNGLLMLTPMSTNEKVLSYRPHGLIFRNTPVSKDYAGLLMAFMRKAGFFRLIIYSDNDDNSRDLADMACTHAHVEGVTLIDRRGFDKNSNEVFFRKDLEEWKLVYGPDFDAILIIGSVRKAAQIIKEAKALDMKQQFFCMDISPDALINISGKAAEGVIISSFDDGQGPKDLRQHFREKFTETFGHGPDTNAMRGYDSLKILAESMASAGSTVPSKIAAALGSRTHEGLFGPVSFDDRGELVQDRCAIFKIEDSRTVKLMPDEWRK